jgi:hypothetical protein
MLILCLTYSSTPDLDATHSSETSLDFQRATRRYILEYGIIEAFTKFRSDSGRPYFLYAIYSLGISRNEHEWIISLTGTIISKHGRKPDNNLLTLITITITYYRAVKGSTSSKQLILKYLNFNFSAGKLMFIEESCKPTYDFTRREKHFHVVLNNNNNNNNDYFFL